MYAAIYTPRARLQAVLQQQPEACYQPAVVLDEAELVTTSQRDRGKLRVLEISSEAEEFGVHLGMTAVQAQARCDYLQLLNRRPAQEVVLTETLLDLADAFTPDYEDTALGLCLLDLRGVAAIEAEAIQQAHQLHERLIGRGYTGYIGIAPNPDLATLAARICAYRDADEGGVLVLHQADVERVLYPLPLAILEPTPQMGELFDLWGLRTLGELVELPRAALVERLGEVAGTLQDRARGRSTRLLRLVRPEAEYTATTELEYELRSTEPLVLLLEQMLESLCAQLHGDYLVAAKLQMQLHLTDDHLYQRVFRIPEPCADVAMLLGILRVHLESYEARAPIVGATLRAIPARPGRHQYELFSSGVKDPNRLSETLVRVEALLGSERFGVPRMQPTHRSDRFEMRPFRPELEPSAPDCPQQLVLSRMPLRRYRPRRHVQVELASPQQPSGSDSIGYKNHSIGYNPDSIGYNRTAHRRVPVRITSGDFKGRILDCSGPHLANGNWWERSTYWKRHEWDIQHEDGCFYRLVEEHGEWYVEAVG